MYGDIENICKMRRIRIVGVATKGCLAGNYILGKRGYLKMFGHESNWMKVNEFKKAFRIYIDEHSFFTKKDRNNDYMFTERASISNTNAYNMWVDNGICSAKEFRALSAEAREGYFSGSSYTDYRIVGTAVYSRRALAECELGVSEYYKERHNGYENDECDEEDCGGE